MSIKIVVVEDDPATMRIISYALKNAGYEVIVGYGGEDAIRKISAHKPDLVLTDLEMPKVSGCDVIAAIRKDPATHQIPVIAVTAHALKDIAQQAMKAGCSGYIAKPFTPAQLIHQLEKYLPPNRSAEGKR